MSDISLDSTYSALLCLRHFLPCITIHLCKCFFQSVDLDRISQRSSCTMSFYIRNVFKIYVAPAPRPSDKVCLSSWIRSCQWACSSSVINTYILYNAVNMIAILNSLWERFENDRTNALSSDISGSFFIKSTRLSVHWQHSRLREWKICNRADDNVYCTYDRRTAFMSLKCIYSMIYSSKRAWTSCVYDLAYTVRIQKIWYPVRKHYMSISGSSLCLNILLSVTYQVWVIHWGNSCEYSCICIWKLRRLMSRILYCLPYVLHDHTVLRIEVFSLSGRDIEEIGIKTSDILHESAPLGLCLIYLGIRISVKFLPVPSVSRYLCYHALIIWKPLPELFKIVTLRHHTAYTDNSNLIIIIFGYAEFLYRCLFFA